MGAGLLVEDAWRRLARSRPMVGGPDAPFPSAQAASCLNVGDLVASIVIEA
jgi:hypothetical protein